MGLKAITPIVETVTRVTKTVTEPFTKTGVFYGKGIATGISDELCITNPVLKRIKELSKNYQSATFNCRVNGGESVNLIEFVGSHSGTSNSGFWATSKDFRNLYFVKMPKDEQHMLNEKLASRLYELAGFDTPNFKTIEFLDNTGKAKKGLISSYKPFERGLSASAKDTPKAMESFGVDCWLANWDSLTGTNTVINGDRIIKMDVGGSLRYRAAGGLKKDTKTPFSNLVEELVSIPKNKSVFYNPTNITHSSLVNSIEKVTKLSDSKIEKIVNELAKEGLENPEEMFKLLKNRKEYMKRVLKAVRETPFEASASFNFSAYMQKITDNVFKLSDNLINKTTSEQRAKLEELYEYYVTISKDIVRHTPSDEIPKGALLHGQEYSKDRLRAVLKDGLISPDIGKLRSCRGDQMTIGGLDTWVSDADRTIRGYFRDWLNTMPEGGIPLTREFSWRGENTWIDLCNKGGRYKITYVINPKANCGGLDEILKYKVTPATKKTTFFGKGDMVKFHKERFERHTYIPVGVPSNYIEKLIVGDKISPEQIKDIKQLIDEAGLDLKVYNTFGELL